MTKSNVNFGIKFHLASDKKTNKKNGKPLSWKGKISYISREEITINHDQIFSGDDKFLISSGYLARDNSRILHKEKFKNYDEENKTMYFSKGKQVKQKDKELIKTNETLLDDLQKNNRGCYYESFISFDKDYAQKNLISKYSEDELYTRLKPYLNNFLKANDFKMDNTKDFVAFHSNTKNLHLHFDFVELEPTRSKNKLDKKSFGELRKEIMLGFDKELKQEYTERTKKVMEDKNKLRDMIKNTSTENINLDKAVELWQQSGERFFNQIKNEELLEEIENIKMQMLDDDNEFSKNYNDFKINLEKQNKFNEQIYGESKRDQKENQLNEIEKVIGNKILRDVKNKSKITSSEEIKNINMNDVTELIVYTSLDNPDVVNKLDDVKSSLLKKDIDQLSDTTNDYEKFINNSILKEIKSKVRQKKENEYITSRIKQNNYKTNNYHNHNTSIKINEFKNVLRRQEIEKANQNIFIDEYEM